MTTLAKRPVDRADRPGALTASVHERKDIDMTSAISRFIKNLPEKPLKGYFCKRSVEAWNMSCVALLTQDTLPIFA